MAAVASVGLLALAACGTEQGAAMFVGDERIAETTVDGYVDSVAELRVQQGQDLYFYDYSGDRYSVVVYMIYSELGHAVGLDPVPGDDELQVLAQEYEAYTSEFYAEAEPRELTQAEMEAAVAAASTNENLANASIEDLEHLAGFTDDLAAYVEEYDISVNPRYGQVDISPLPSVFPVEVPQR